jgi:Protein of unknown function, DUF547
MNELINLREAAIGLLAGVREGEVLNAAPYAGPARPGPELAAELKQAVNGLRAAAISADGSRVDYGSLRASAAYARYRTELTSQLRGLDLASLGSREERLAFWINLYNALVIDGVIALGVRRSVREQLAGLAFFRRAAYTVGGLRFSCEDIENGILRANAGNPFIPGPQFGQGDPRLPWALAAIDPRIHCALNCASRSCPPVGVYAAKQIDSQLDLAARSFVSADTEVDPRSATLTVSAIYSWYSGDFGGPEGAVRFVRQHLPDDQRRAWLSSGTPINMVHRAYDWALNV